MHTAIPMPLFWSSCKTPHLGRPATHAATPPMDRYTDSAVRTTGHSQLYRALPMYRIAGEGGWWQQGSQSGDRTLRTMRQLRADWCGATAGQALGCCAAALLPGKLLLIEVLQVVPAQLVHRVLCYGVYFDLAIRALLPLHIDVPPPRQRLQ